MSRKPDGVVVSNWHTLFEGFSTSTQEFYQAVEEAVKSKALPEIEISRVLWSEGGVATAKREYLRIRRKNIAFDICSAPYGSGHFFSWWLARIPPRFGIFSTIGVILLALGLLILVQAMATSLLRGCLGTVITFVLPLFFFPMILFFLGYWVQEGDLADEEWVISLPILGPLYVFVFNPLTYYRLDTAYMFRDAVRAAVNGVINDLREQKGLRHLGEDEFRMAGDHEP